MKWSYLAPLAPLTSLALLAACDNAPPVDGLRSPCAAGGSIGGCPQDPPTPEGACDRLVQCGAIPLNATDNNYDWGRCVDQLAQLTADRQAFVIACIAASSCDALRVEGSPGNPYQRLFCLNFGAQ
jgi:hypothetical protein